MMNDVDITANQGIDVNYSLNQDTFELLLYVFCVYLSLCLSISASVHLSISPLVSL